VLRQAQALGLLVVVTVVLLGLSYATNRVTGLPGAVSFIAVGTIALGVTHYHRTYREVPPRKDSPLVRYRPTFNGRRRYTSIGGKKFFIVECVCTDARIWMLPSNMQYRLELRLDTATGESYGFNRELAANSYDLDLLLTACRQLESEHGHPVAAPVDCLIDEEGGLHGITIVSHDGPAAYMW
jgi:hypothetical protein